MLCNVALRAAAQVKSDKSYYKVHLVGGSSVMVNLHALATDLDIEDKVVLHRRFPLEEFLHFYKFLIVFHLRCTLAILMV